MDIRMSALNLAQYLSARLIELARLQEACGYETFWYTDRHIGSGRMDARPLWRGLEGSRGRPVERATLRRLFGEVQCLRMVNRYGFVRVPRLYIYAEPGLSRQRVALWVYEGARRIASQETRRASYRGAYDQRQRRLQDVRHPLRYQTRLASPPLE